MTALANGIEWAGFFIGAGLFFGLFCNAIWRK